MMTDDEIYDNQLRILRFARANNWSILWDRTHNLVLEGINRPFGGENNPAAPLLSEAMRRMVDELDWFKQDKGARYSATQSGRQELEKSETLANITEPPSEEDRFLTELKIAYYADRGESAKQSALKMDAQTFLNQLISGLSGSDRPRALLALMAAREQRQSLDTITDRISKFVDSVREEGDRASKDAAKMLKESQALRLWTFWLMVATVVMAVATIVMACTSVQERNEKSRSLERENLQHGLEAKQLRDRLDGLSAEQSRIKEELAKLKLQGQKLPVSGKLPSGSRK